ncbi:L-threonylcarbamoyladenylate synthase [Microbulbifer guangxiensis]|uniref:L-threonylcarbamoyladenylate synthase n=1 Tax=Microbulbifer guangxiensis TaxID=2904249 RepID=UPI001EFFEFC7
MKTEYLDKGSINRAAELLSAGELVALPTETVYGLAADAYNPDAVAATFAAKGRPADHPLIVHLSSVQEMAFWAASVPQEAWDLANRFWPGPLTLLLRKGKRVPDVITGGRDTVALRLPAHSLFLLVLKRLGRAVTAPSANRHKRLSPTSAGDVRRELDGCISGVLDGGDCALGLESTILDLTAAPRILRPGPISAKEIESCLGQAVEQPVAHSVAVAGNLREHYRPQAPVWLVPAGSLDRVVGEVQSARLGVLHLPGNRPTIGNCIEMPPSAVDFGARLYRQMRDLDESGCEAILVEEPPADVSWAAVHDRLRRAAMCTASEARAINEVLQSSAVGAG